MNEDTVKKMALVIAANCLHQELSENDASANVKPSQTDLSKQVADRLYTYLLYLLNKPSHEYASLMEELSKNYPYDWASPELDAGFMQIVNQAAHNQQGPMI